MTSGRDSSSISDDVVAGAETLRWFKNPRYDLREIYVGVN